MTNNHGLTHWRGALAILGPAKRQRAESALRRVVGPSLNVESLEEREDRAAARHLLGHSQTMPDSVSGRAEARWLEEETARQSNRESVAQRTLELLDADIGSEETTEEETLDPDWLNVFTSHAERASGASLREMWARVLAGEIRKPGVVSLRTLQFASTLDLHAAKAIQALASWVYNDQFLPFTISSHLSYETMQLLHDEGLIGSMDSDITTTITLSDGWWPAVFGNVAVFLKGAAGGKAITPGISLSRIAKEFLSTIALTRDTTAPLAFAESFKSDGAIDEIKVGPVIKNGDNLSMPDATLIFHWTRPKSTPPFTPETPGAPLSPPPN